MPKRVPTRRSSDGRWGNWFGLGGARRRWPGRSSPRARRSATGRSRLTAMKGSATMEGAAPSRMGCDVSGKQLRTGRPILVRARTWFGREANAGLRPVYEFVGAHQADFPVTAMCRVLKVSSSGYYAWGRRPPWRRTRADAGLRPRVEKIHQRSRGTYGARRIQAEVAEQGRRVSRKRVGRLMLELGVGGACRRRQWSTTGCPPPSREAPHLVRREFTAAGPNQLWVADPDLYPAGPPVAHQLRVASSFSPPRKKRQTAREKPG